jgi:hypothetical protein
LPSIGKEGKYSDSDVFTPSPDWPVEINNFLLPVLLHSPPQTGKSSAGK